MQDLPTQQSDGQQDAPISPPSTLHSPLLKRRFFLLILFFIGISIMGGVLFLSMRKEQPMTTSQTTPVRVRLAWLNQAQFAGIFVAQDKDMYKKVGLTVESIPFSFENDQIKEVAQGGVNFTVVSAGEFIKGVSEGYPIKAIMAVYQTSPYAFASLQEKNIVSPQDFKGKVLGVEGGNDQARLTYIALMNSFSVASSSVTFKNLNFDEVDDLGKHRADVIDLYRTDQPYRIMKAGYKLNLIYPERFEFEQYGDVIITSEKYLQEHPEQVRAFLQGTVEGWEYALAHNDEAVAIIMKRDDKTYHDAVYEKYILEQSRPLIQPTGGKRIGTMDYVLWRRTYDALEKSGQLKKPFDVSSAYTTDYLPK